MFEGNRTITWQFVKVGDAHVSAESASDYEDNLQSKLLERSGQEIKRNSCPTRYATRNLIQSVKELSERSSNRSTEGNVESEQSRSSGRRSDTVQEADYFLKLVKVHRKTFPLTFIAKVSCTKLLSSISSRVK